MVSRTVAGDAPEPRDPALEALSAPSDRPRPVRLLPISKDTYSLRITVDLALKQDLDTLRALLGHKLPRADLAAIVREAVRCAIEHHGRRKGAVSPAGKRAADEVETPTRPAPRSSPSSPGSGLSRPAVPRHVRREVWARDGGRCTFVAVDGQRCGTRDRLELDHVHPHALGGQPTVANLRLRCRAHNLLEAERALGTEIMRRFTGVASRARSST
jgi:hypothetical protein